MSNHSTSDLTAWERDRRGNGGESEVLGLIDQAVSAAKQAAHAAHDETAREHFEFALALLRESWIAESGQVARSAREVVEDVERGLRIIARLQAVALQPVVELEED